MMLYHEKNVMIKHEFVLKVIMLAGNLIWLFFHVS